MPNLVPTKVTIDLGQLFLALPLIQKFIVDISNPSLTPEGKVKVVSEFVRTALIATEAIIHDDLVDDIKFQELMNSLVVLVIAGMDTYEKGKAVLNSLPKQ